MQVKGIWNAYVVFWPEVSKNVENKNGRTPLQDPALSETMCQTAN